MASKTKQQIIDELTQEISDLEKDCNELAKEAVSKADYIRSLEEAVTKLQDRLRDATTQVCAAARQQDIIDELCERVEAAEESLDIVTADNDALAVLIDVGTVVMQAAVNDLENLHAENQVITGVLGGVAQIISQSFADPDAHDYVEDGIITEIEALPMLLCLLLDEVAHSLAVDTDTDPADGFGTDTPDIDALLQAARNADRVLVDAVAEVIA